jgi:hypothetical protein
LFHDAGKPSWSTAARWPVGYPFGGGYSLRSLPHHDAYPKVKDVLTPSEKS